MRLAKALGLLALLTAACGKGPAQAALSAADGAVSSARAEGAKFVPDQFKALSDSAAAARARFDAGDYRAALEQAQGIPALAQTVMQQAVAKKGELTASWKGLEGSLPPLLTALGKRVVSLAAMKKLPPGIDRTKFEGAKTMLESATAAWADAGGAFSQGDLMAAVAKAGQARSTAMDLTAVLGMSAEAAAPTKK